MNESDARVEDDLDRRDIVDHATVMDGLKSHVRSAWLGAFDQL